MQNNHVFLQNYYHTPFYSPIKNNSFSQNNIINLNDLSNQNINININHYPLSPLRVAVPKQSSNIYFMPRTPSPSYNRRNFINLNDNTKFKDPSNSPIIYHKLRGIDHLNNSYHINYHQLRNMSPQPSLNKNPNNNSLISLYINTPIYINAGQRVPKLIRTPEPKDNYSKSRNYNNNIRYFNTANYESIPFNKVQNLSNIRINNNTPLNKVQNLSYIRINNIKQIKQIPKINNNNYLKNEYNNIKIIKYNDLNKNKNNNENIQNIITSYNSDNSNNNNHNILIKNLNYYNPNFSFVNNNTNENNNNNIYHNNKFQNIFNNRKIPNGPTDNYKNKIRPKYIPDIFHNYNNQNQNNIHSKIFNYNNKNGYNKNPNICNISNQNDSSIDINISNQNIQPNICQNPINIIPIPKNKYFQKSENGLLRKNINDKQEPGDDFDIREFKKIKQIGEGTYGIIFCVQWRKNNEFYALKKINIVKEELKFFKKNVRIIKDLLKTTQHNGFIKIYGDKLVPKKKSNEFDYYVIMELADEDWESEIITRKEISLYYSEYQLLQIISQLVKTLSLMQNNNVTHRDIKPQNILICKDVFKICDFDALTKIEGKGTILQQVRGSELYMSPILFYAYNSNVPNVLHNTYKSDVFSLGMTVFLAATLSAKPLCDIRELKDMIVISKIINDSLNQRYSQNFINLMIKMLQIDENLRCDFIELEEYITHTWPQ